MSGETSERFPWLRVFYWTVRREVWEHRAVYVAPLAAAALGLVGVLLSSLHAPAMLRAAMANPKKADLLMAPHAVIALAVLATGLVFAGFYAIGALHGERRDRSILFWKSLPVSDLTAVLAKAAVPLVLLPAVMFAVVAAGQLAALALTTLAVMLAGLDPRELWSRLHMGFMWAAFGRSMIIMPLWYAPLVAWLLLVSAWARRMPILWAFGPFVAIGAVEGALYGRQGGLFSSILLHRITGGFTEAYSIAGKGKAVLGAWRDLELGHFLTNPQMWAGLVHAAVFLAITVRLRRSADTI